MDGHYYFFREFPLDMAGFAVNVHSILDNPDAWYGRTRPRSPSEEKTSESTLETAFLEHFATRETVECRGTYKEVGPGTCMHCASNSIYCSNLLGLELMDAHLPRLSLGWVTTYGYNHVHNYTE